jgi:hypothetical protein
VTKLMKKTLLTIAALAAFGSMTVGAAPHASALDFGTRHCDEPDPLLDHETVWVNPTGSGPAGAPAVCLTN